MFTCLNCSEPKLEREFPKNSSICRACLKQAKTHKISKKRLLGSLTCFRCGLLKDKSKFYPNQRNLHGWCIDCIKSENVERPHRQKLESELRERDQNNILAVVKQFQTNNEPFVYLLLSGNRYKIGFTTNLEQRIQTFNTASPIPHQIIAVVPGDAALEAELHDKLSSKRVFGEWFVKCPDVFQEFQKLPKVMIFLEGFTKSSIQ